MEIVVSAMAEVVSPAINIAVRAIEAPRIRSSLLPSPENDFIRDTD
jgi:hypothetical protein